MRVVMMPSLAMGIKMLIRGKDYELKRASELRQGDECIFGTNWDAHRDFIVRVWNDPEGIWIDWESDECGYAREGNYRYRVLL